MTKKWPTPNHRHLCLDIQAEDAREAGKKRITPYWRPLKAKGEVNPKYPGGIDAARKHLAAEGHQVEQRGKRFFVKDYEKALVKW